jgi:tetratricopeptide (TPR) repeat protein
MKTGFALAVAGWFSLSACSAGAGADEYSSLLRARKFAEVEMLANARLALDPDDANALAAKADAIVATGPAARFDEAVALAERCIAAHPQRSGCFLALGNALGAKATHAGPVSAMGHAARIRDAVTKAVELDPRNTDARFALLDYYMQAPAIIGGGKGKARALAAQTNAINPAAARLMQAQLALADKDLPQAEATLMAVHPGNDQMVADRQRDLLIELGNRYASDNHPADSTRVLRVVQERFPESGSGSRPPGPR